VCDGQANHSGSRPSGHRHIDLFVVTHIDHDYIGGAGLLLNDSALSQSFGDRQDSSDRVWRYVTAAV